MICNLNVNLMDCRMFNVKLLDIETMSNVKSHCIVNALKCTNTELYSAIESKSTELGSIY